jgi:hypothetical protein
VEHPVHLNIGRPLMSSLTMVSRHRRQTGDRNTNVWLCVTPLGSLFVAGQV